MDRIKFLRIGTVASAVFALASVGLAVRAQYQGRTEYCFGAVGPMCAGAPGAGVTELGNGRVKMKASVGSILHDNCCLANPDGKWCGKHKEFGHNGTCDKEWNKAVWNTIDGRQWDVEFNKNTKANLKVVSNPRKAVFNSNYQGGGIPRNFETEESRRLSAPRGTALDVGDQEFCASGRASSPKSSFGKTWIVCE
jgi:hypothetical protein